MSNDVLDMVGSATVVQRGQRLENPGKYLLEVNALKWMPDAYGGPTFVGEFKVRSAQETSNEKLRFNTQQGMMEKYTVKPHKVGEDVSVAIVLKTKKDDPSQGNLLKLLSGVTGLPIKTTVEKDDPAKGLKAGDEVPTFNKAGILQLAEDSQPMKGQLVEVTVWDHPQKTDPKKIFTEHRWVSVDQAQAKASLPAA